MYLSSFFFAENDRLHLKYSDPALDLNRVQG
jgi:hypothetical protein